tara:strand:- start:8612 stop:8833 length:222 start_codon:yes stop_codon:yes gene_type:complete
MEGFWDAFWRLEFFETTLLTNFLLVWIAVRMGPLRDGWLDTLHNILFQIERTNDYLHQMERSVSTIENNTPEQ